MYITVAIYADWAWTCWAWFRALQHDCTAGSVIELFLHHHLCCSAYWSALACSCTAAADDSDVSLKTVSLVLCSTVVCEASSDDVVSRYWCWETRTLKWNLCKTQFCSLICWVSYEKSIQNSDTGLILTL